MMISKLVVIATKKLAGVVRMGTLCGRGSVEKNVRHLETSGLLQQVVE
jgi:hypothetical protein